MIDLQKKVIYTHPQKSGGTSIESVFTNSMLTRKHDSLYRHIEILNERGLDHTEYYKFSSIRNPWDAVVSHYFYDKKYIKTSGIKIRGKKRYEKIRTYDFQAYVRERIFYGGDVKYFMFNGDEFDLDRVVRFENLRDDFDRVCDDIGVDRVELPHINKTSHKHYTEYYNDEMMEIVAETFKQSIDMFGYKFGE